MIRRLQDACCLGLLALTTACHGECYTMRRVDASGRFGDTLVAVSGSGTQPGTVFFRIVEQQRDPTFRYLETTYNASGTIDTVSLYRLTLVSDPTRAAVFTGTRPGTFTPDSVAFEKLFVHLATEDVLFELVGKSGAVVKALLNLEERQGPKEACDPYT